MEIAPALFEHSAMGDLLARTSRSYNQTICIVAWTRSPLTSKRCSRSFASAGKTCSGRFRGAVVDLTSTYFECDPPDDGKRKFGYSRDKRSIGASRNRADRHAGWLPLAYKSWTATPRIRRH